MNFVHIAISIIFISVAIVLTYRSIMGWFYGYKFTKTDHLLARTFLLLLYVSLVLGFILYFVFTPFVQIDPQNIHEANKRVTLRFWAVEHLYCMTFALIFSQIGHLFFRKSISDRNRFAYSAFYNGVATLITIVSMLFYFIYR